ncbi:hypothetical protein Tco_1524185 [Tanacetum coccineum]
MIITSDLFDKIKAAQVEALKEENWKSECITSYIPHLKDDSRGVKTRQGRIYIPFQIHVKDLLLEEAHKSKYLIHPGATKMYLDMKKNYWWPRMKRDCVKYVEKCLTCLKVKAEHQKPYGKVQPIEIPVWKWEKITIDFVTKLPRPTKKHDAIWIVARHGVPISIVSDRDGRFTSNFWQDFQEELGNWDDHLPLVEFAYNNSYHTSIKMPPYEMLYGRRCRTSVCWDEVGSRELESTDVVLATTKKIETIRGRLKAAQDRWKSYANNRRRPIEFNVGDFVMLKVSPWKGVLRFKNKGKLSPRFIGPFKILKRVGEVAYVLELREEIRGIHNTFHVSYLRKCLAKESSVITLDDVEIDTELTSREESITILGRKSRQLRNKIIPLVKVEWKHRKGTSIRCVCSMSTQTRKEKEENLEIDQIGEIEQEEKKYKPLGTLNCTLYTNETFQVAAIIEKLPPSWKDTYTPDSAKANMVEHVGSSLKSNYKAKGKGKGKRKNDNKSKGKAEYLAPKAGIVK